MVRIRCDTASGDSLVDEIRSYFCLRFSYVLSPVRKGGRGEGVWRGGQVGGGGG